MKLLIFVAVALPFTVTAQIFLVSFRAFQKPQYEVMIKELIEKSSKVIITFILFLFGFRLLGAAAGFVLAIIIIAYATIFRRQSYAMNKTLGKLVIAALLVNFSFAIASGIISVSNNLTQYMVDKM